VEQPEQYYSIFILEGGHSMTSIATNNTTGSEFVNVEYANVKSDLIHITDDKLRNILNDFIPNVKKSNDWVTPFSIGLTLLITFLTTDFSNDFLGISKSIWSVIFIIVFIVSLIWLIISIANYYRLRKITKIEFLINKIKNKS
jgi:membrane protein insertase Oxa1/YidC/SpoIIIJ